MYQRILVPTDGSDLSDEAARAAIDFARLCKAEVVALAVAEPYPMFPAAEGAMVVDPGVETEVLMKYAQENVDKVAQAAASAGIRCTTETVVSMVPWQAIIDAAARHGCDLVFMASHGRRGLSKLLAGSVTQNVLAYSTVPVMVLRPAHGHKLPPSGQASTGA